MEGTKLLSKMSHTQILERSRVHKLIENHNLKLSVGKINVLLIGHKTIQASCCCLFTKKIQFHIQ